MTTRDSASLGKSKNTGDAQHHATTVAAREKKARDTAWWDRRVQMLSVASFTLGCVWIFLFPLVTVTTGEAKPRGTFFDENAMLIHHTSTKLTAADVDWARPAPLSEAFPWDGLGGGSWVCKVLSGMDLPCHTHTFYDRPAARSGLRTSVYTVLEPAPGSDGKECLVLTTSQDLSGSAEQMLDRPHFAGLSLSLAVLKQLKDHVGWMSKRVIVLIADEDLSEPGAERLHLGVKNFIDDYHSNTFDLLDRHAKDSNMTASIQHGGVIRAALSLENPQPGEPEVVQLLTSGINGELPNMDLLNAAVFHHEHQGLGVLLDTCSGPQDDGPFACPDAAARAARASRRRLPHSAKGDAAQRYLDRLFFMLGFMGSATIGPSGPHAHLLRHSVDALTIRSLVGDKREANGKGQRTTSGSGVSSTAAVLSIVRGVSNLEEELHHSFFRYLMLSTSSFVSIGEYAYALVLLLVPLALQGRRLVAINEDKQLLGAVLVVGIFQVFGALLLRLASVCPEPSAEQLAVYLQVIDLAGYALILLLGATGLTKKAKRTRRPFWEGPKMVMSCLVGYSCTVTALLSWQVAAVIALTHVPLLTMVRPFQRKSFASWCMALAMAITSPAQWSTVLGWLTAHASGTGVMLQWLRWFRLSGLLNVPLMCFVSMPVHLTVAFVMFAPSSEAKGHQLSAF